MSAESLKAIDLFCGAGGLTRGLRDAGISVVAGIDIDHRCKETYEANNAGAKFIALDIARVSRFDIEAALGHIDCRSLVLAGCAPCQPFSKQRRNGEYTKQRTLLSDFGRLVEDIRPGYVLMENVPGIARVRGRSTFRRFVSTLTTLKYHVAFDVLDAKDFGVAQTRRRLVLIASRFARPSLPTPTHGKGRTPFLTVRQAIGGLPPVELGVPHAVIPNHVSATLSQKNMARLRATPIDGGSRASWPKHLRLRCHSKGYKGHTDVYGRLKWNEPAPALTCRCIRVSSGRYAHPEQNRGLTLREAAALQSFPNDYVFCGQSLGALSAFIGNAVPVILARAVGEALVTTFRGRRAGKRTLT